MRSNLVYQESMDRLAKILDFGAHYLNCKKIDIKKIRMRKNILFKMTIAAHNYTESIYCLCKEGRSQACHALLRALTENLINAKYLFITKNSTNAKSFYLNTLEEKKKQISLAIEFLKKDPISCSSSLSLKDLQKAQKKIKTQIKKINQNNSIPRFPPIKERAQQIDKYNKTNGISSASFDWEYILIFKTLCNPSHLSHQGLSGFLEYDSQGFLNVFLSGNPNDIEAILQHTHRLYEDMIKMFINKFKLPHSSA